MAKKKVLKKKQKKKNGVKKSAAKRAKAKKAGVRKKPVPAKKTAPQKKAAAAPEKSAGRPARGEPRPAIMPTALQASGVVLKEGMPAPAFELPADTGEMVSLESFRGKSVVLYFYPKDDTPGCTKEACDFRDQFARLQSAGAVVLGVSKDSVLQHQKFKAKYSLPFSLLADVDAQALLAYGVWKEKSMYGRSYMGIERTTVLIDAEGIIRKIYHKVSVPGHVEQVLRDLKALK